ncbi:hypothetical protein BDV09DRAFT_188246 [Aspergillus tetrazonus]
MSDQTEFLREPTSQAGPAAQGIQIQHFSERITVWPEDWSGISDPKLRRKLQNRLNQRALRLRKKLDAQATPSDNLSNSNRRSSTELEVSRKASPIIGSHQSQISNVQSKSHNTTALALPTVGEIHILEPNTPKTKRILHHFELIALSAYATGSPRTDMLLHLIQFNFIKALIENMAVLGLSSDQLDDDANSPFNTMGPSHPYLATSLPLSLRATMIQRTIPHHPWLDLLPFPQMRDNLISAGESYDETQLCLDMKGYGNPDMDHTGIIVWRDPWDPEGWEVTESFARNWGWVLAGCWDLLRSTNSWRARRGERPLFW